MLFLDNNYLIFESNGKFSADDLLSAFVADRCYLDFYPDTKIVLPVVEKPMMAKRVPIPGFFKMPFNKDNPKHKDMLKSAIEKSGVSDITDDVILKLLEVHAAVRSELPITRDISYLARGKADVIEALEMRTVTAGFIPKVQNITLFQRTPEDKIFIKIPSDIQIKSFQDDYTEAPVPNMSDVFSPYPSPLYRFPRIGSILDASPVQRPAVIRQIVDALKKDFKGFTKDSQTYADTFQELPAAYVFGDSINNYLPIQDNERDYYDTLISFMKHHILMHNKNLYKDFDKEKLNAQTESDFNTGIFPAGVRLYFEKLLASILEYQYFHTGAFSQMKDEFNDGDNGVEERASSSEKEKDEVVSSRVFFRNVGEGGRLIQSDADMVLNEYLQNSSKTQGCSVYAEAVIKLLRWGSRKPIMLIAGEDNPSTFDLEKMRSVTSTIDFSKLVPVDEDGRTYQVHGYVTLPVERDGLSYETVAVLLMNQLYKNPHTDGDEYVFYAISVPDFISEYKTNEKIIGVDYNGSNFEVAEDMRTLTQYNLSDILTHRFIQTNATMDTLTTLSVKNAQSPAYAIIHSNDLYAFDVDVNRPVTQAVLAFPEAERTQALNMYWYKSFISKCPVIDSDNLQEILDAYCNVDDEPVPKPADVADFAYKLMFSDNKEEEEEFDMKQTVYSGDTSKLTFKPIAHKNKNVFAYAYTPEKEMVYAALDEVKVDNMIEPDKPFSHITAMLSIFASLDGGKMPAKASFISVGTLVKIMSELYKK